MTGQQLKNSILQLAIQGKLVPQDPNDEPASELLKRIRKEKEQMVKAGKLKKKDLEVTPIAEDEKPFEIPESWEWIRISDMIYPPKYGTSNKSTSNGKIPVLRMGNIQNGRITYDKLVYSNNEEDNVNYLLQYNDLLFNRTNSAELVGKTGIYKAENPAIFAGYLILLRTIITDTADYINYVLSSKYARSYCFLIKTIGVQQCNINAEKISAFLMPLPPLAEQKRIVAKIEELLPLVEEYGKAQEELNKLNATLPDKLRQSILQEAIMGKLVPQDPNDEPASKLLERIQEEKKRLVKEGKLKKKDLEVTPITEDEKPFEIPKNWEWVRLKQIFNIVSARRVHQKDWRTSGIPFYRTREIGWLSENKNVQTELFIEESFYNELKKNGCPKVNDIMLTAVGTIGKTYIVKPTDKFYYKDASVLCMENYGMINPLFICNVISSSYFKEMAAKEAMGTTVATITIVRANEYLIPLPPLAEQHRIVAKLEEILPKLDELK